MTAEKIKEIILKHSKISITFGSPRYVAIENSQINELAKEICSQFENYLCDAYRTGQTDGYDCGKIDSRPY
jgi:hypothetical protein